MTLAKETIRCPYCREPIVAGATRCKHCHADLTERKSAKKSWLGRVNTFRVGFLSGILFTIIVFWLVYLQFFSGD